MDIIIIIIIWVSRILDFFSLALNHNLILIKVHLTANVMGHPPKDSSHSTSRVQIRLSVKNWSGFYTNSTGRSIWSSKISHLIPQCGCKCRLHLSLVRTLRLSDAYLCFGANNLHDSSLRHESLRLTRFWSCSIPVRFPSIEKPISCEETKFRLRYIRQSYSLKHNIHNLSREDRDKAGGTLLKGSDCLRSPTRQNLQVSII